MSKQIKQILIFTLCLLPIALVGGAFSAYYQLDLYGEEMRAEIISTLGSEALFAVITALQSMGYAAVCGFVGGLLAHKLELWKPIRFEKKPLLLTLALSLPFGVLFSLDYWTFGATYPAIREATLGGLTVSGHIAAVLYGGVIEEVMLRLFFLSLVAWILWKVFARKQQSAPTWVLVSANVAAALLFAAGHLPATVMTFGTLTPLLLVRCFLFNGGFALMFGYLYRKHGIHYAMISHAMLHVVSRVIWIAFA